MMAIAATAVVFMAAASVVDIVPIQQAAAQDTEFEFEQEQENECSGFAGCSNTGVETF